VRTELTAAHAAVDEAVAILRDGRARPHERIEKAAKDFLTDVDLASESAMQRSLAASTPEIGFYGEEGGGAALDSGKVWVADPLDGTINYATGSPLCGVMLGLLEDGVPTLGVIDLPFLGVRVDSGRRGRRWLARGRDHRDGRRIPPGRCPAGRVPRTHYEGAPTGAALSLRRRGVCALGLARQRPDPGHAASP
jgi:fructose-1,6-bisphosphatase/inositol monophosphatase family enzyme